MDEQPKCSRRVFLDNAPMFAICVAQHSTIIRMNDGTHHVCLHYTKRIMIMLAPIGREMIIRNVQGSTQEDSPIWLVMNRASASSWWRRNGDAGIFAKRCWSLWLIIRMIAPSRVVVKHPRELWMELVGS